MTVWLFAIVSLVESWILLQLSFLIPFTSLIILCGISGAAGGWLVHQEGLALWTFLETEIQNRRIPSEELLDAVFLLVSGVALLIPGVLSDLLGVALLIPDIRAYGVHQVHQYYYQVFQESDE